MKWNRTDTTRRAKLFRKEKLRTWKNQGGRLSSSVFPCMFGFGSKCYTYWEADGTKKNDTIRRAKLLGGRKVRTIKNERRMDCSSGLFSPLLTGVGSRLAFCAPKLGEVERGWWLKPRYFYSRPHHWHKLPQIFKKKEVWSWLIWEMLLLLLMHTKTPHRLWWQSGCVCACVFSRGE